MDEPVRLVVNPTKFCNWVVYPLLLVGGYPFDTDEFRAGHLKVLVDMPIDTYINLCTEEEISDFGRYDDYVLSRTPTAKIVNVPIPDRSICTDDVLADLVQLISLQMKSGKRVYVHCLGGHGRSGVAVACVVQRWLGMAPPQSLAYITTMHLSRGYKPRTPTPRSQAQIAQVKRYRRPIRVIVCGDRNSGTEFEDEITTELKSLPKYSRVIHGGCKGVDLYAGAIARSLGLEEVVYSIPQEEWNRLGNSAGPIRNRRMLVEQTPDMILVFHPDIAMSKGTSDMMVQGWNSGVSVYIHDLKRKSKFEGDFGVL
jgi:protein-tyrosine phosphatase